MDSLLQWVSQYGYAGLFGLLLLGIVGLPVPDETLLVFSGYLMAKGHFRPVWLFLAAFGGTASGISISYGIGRMLSYKVIGRFGRYIRLTPDRLEKVHHWFRKTGNWLLAIGYFVPGLRHFTALVAGMSGLQFPLFALFAYTGGALWVSVFLTLGYFVGEQWQSVLALVHRYTILIVVLAAIGLILFVTVRKRRFERGIR